MLCRAIKSASQKNGIIQLAMAHHLGFESQQKYSDLENGKRHFSAEVLLKICSFFNVSILEFGATGKGKDEHLFLTETEQKEVLSAGDDHVKLIVYKKLLLESKIENVETRLRSFGTEQPALTPGYQRHKVYVII